MTKKKSEAVPQPFFEARFDDLVQVVKAIMPAASKDETRAHLNSICFEIEDGGVRALATNGHWLAKWEGLEHVDEHEPGSFLVPLYAAKQFLALAKDNVECAVVRVYANKIVLPPMQLTLIGGGESVIAFTRVDAEFPPWRQIVPPDSAYASSMAERAIGVACDYVADVARSFKAAGAKGFVLEFAGLIDPIRITSDAAKKLLVILMPMRVDTNGERIEGPEDDAPDEDDEEAAQ